MEIRREKVSGVRDKLQVKTRNGRKMKRKAGRKEEKWKRRDRQQKSRLR